MGIPVSDAGDEVRSAVYVPATTVRDVAYVRIPWGDGTARDERPTWPANRGRTFLAAAAALATVGLFSAAWWESARSRSQWPRSQIRAATVLQDASCNAEEGRLAHGDVVLTVGGIKSMTGCCNIASNTQNAGGWVWLEKEGVCKVLDDGEIKLEEVAGAVSGFFRSFGNGDPVEPQASESQDEEIESEWVCGKVEDEIDYLTGELLDSVGDVLSFGECCEKCHLTKDCRAWSWGRMRGVDKLSDVCFLKTLGKTLEKKPKEGVVSGLASIKFEEPPPQGGANVQADDGSVAAPKEVKCPGELPLEGYGSMSLINADVNRLGVDSAPVEISATGEVTIKMGGRAYGGSSCEAGPYNRSQYGLLRLLGKTLSYTVDLNGAGCGCNAAVYLSSMARNKDEGTCGDYYCDAMSVCGVPCAEIDLQEANQHAWFSTMHNYHYHWGPDKLGAYRGFGGSEAVEARRDWTSTEYGPGAACIDTNEPFRVSISFPVDSEGNLSGFDVRLKQTGKPCDVTASVDSYMIRWPGIEEQNGKEILGKELEAGMTLVMSYWSSDNMLWLDGPGGDGEGPCTADDASACPDSVQLSDFSVQPISGSTA